MKKIKKIYGICDECSKQLYPKNLLDLDRLKAITVCMGKCDICGIRRMKVPIRDYHYALGDDTKWD